MEEEYVMVKAKDLDLIMSRLGKYLTFDAIAAAESLKSQLVSQGIQTQKQNKKEMKYMERKIEEMKIN